MAVSDTPGAQPELADVPCCEDAHLGALALDIQALHQRPDGGGGSDVGAQRYDSDDAGGGILAAKHTRVALDILVLGELQLARLVLAVNLGLDGGALAREGARIVDLSCAAGSATGGGGDCRATNPCSWP